MTGDWTDWTDWYRAAGGILNEAAGWGRETELSDDEQVLAWAREYLPRILAHAADVPGGAA